MILSPQDQEDLRNIETKVLDDFDGDILEINEQYQSLKFTDSDGVEIELKTSDFTRPTESWVEEIHTVTNCENPNKSYEVSITSTKKLTSKERLEILMDLVKQNTDD